MSENENEGEHAVIQGRGPHDEPSRAEQQPQELGHSSAPPAEAQSGIGASGIPDSLGGNGGPTPGPQGEQGGGEQ